MINKKVERCTLAAVINGGAILKRGALLKHHGLPSEIRIPRIIYNGKFLFMSVFINCKK